MIYLSRNNYYLITLQKLMKSIILSALLLVSTAAYSQELDDAYLESLPESIKGDVLEKISEKELEKGKLEKALNQLNDRYQIILKLYYLEGYDHQEISEIMNWSPGNCRTTLSRAREQLKKLLI